MKKDYDEIYCYEGTDTLKNKQNIHDTQKLENYERSVVAIKLMALNKQGITGKFDIQHLKDIHFFLFGDIYPFAGEFRRENISKGYFQFATWEYIESELSSLLQRLQEENYLLDLSQEDFVQRLAYYWSELNVLHPFREGNR